MCSLWKDAYGTYLESSVLLLVDHKTYELRPLPGLNIVLVVGTYGTTHNSCVVDPEGKILLTKIENFF